MQIKTMIAGDDLRGQLQKSATSATAHRQEGAWTP